MEEVVVHIYDVTNSGSEKTNNTILQINRIFKDGIGLGGIFHSAVQVYGDEEWSFGFCEYGSGVFSCPPRRNPMYTYRESIVLGKTNCSVFMVNQILRELSRAWPGSSYDLLSRNCNHFCDSFCELLGVPKLPGGWYMAGDSCISSMQVQRPCAPLGAQNTQRTCHSHASVTQLRQARTEIVNASKVAYRFITGVASNTPATPETPSNSSNANPCPRSTWFTNLMNSVGAKPSSSTLEYPEDSSSSESEEPLESEDEHFHQQQKTRNK
ncbi:desumoylating isopeptidase 1 homolog isoform X1 [Phoenix dactylifera]|uniref:Desumoylating isopeptidase 1 homolog isoform X1 n=1 Tax=Phoenix dactylifera TaxID=42345 RepID=A0A8B8J7U9_PHODC|nr:desumoylating isopeptidase 1 homolog isoform X1 [Phoenix dactylifera]